MAFWISAGIAAGAALLNHYNTVQTADKQDNALAAKLRMDQFDQRLQSSRVNQLLQKTAKSNAQPSEQADRASYAQQIRKAMAQAQQPLALAGPHTSAYDQAAADATSGMSSYADTRAGHMAAVDAPIQQRQQEQIDRSNAALDLADVARRAKMQDFLANMRLSNIRRNPWLDLVSKAASTYAGSRADAAGSGAGLSGGGDLYSTGSGTYNLPFKTAG